MSKPFIQLLREYDHALGRTPMRQLADARIRRALRRSPPRRFPGPKWAWAGALCAIGVLTLWAFGPRRERPPSVAQGAHCTVLAGSAGERRYQGECDLRLPHMAIQTGPDTSMLEQGDRVELVRGRARFRVQHVAPGAPPVRVQVAVGFIEVLGTEFEVRQDEKRGSVALVSGRIQLVLEDSRRIRLGPGEQYSWSLPLPVARARATGTRGTEGTRADSASVPPAANEPPTGVLPRVAERTGAVREGPAPVAEVVRLRSQGRYLQALAVVDGRGSANIDSRSREILSYERGSLLERLGRREAACAQWREHAARFPTGRYAAAVARTLEAKCSVQSREPGSRSETSEPVAGE